MRLTSINLKTTMLVDGLRQSKIAKILGVSPSKLSRIVNGEISADTLNEDTVDALFIDYPVLDTLFVPASTTAFNADTVQPGSPREADILSRMAYTAADSIDSDDTRKMIYIRTGVRAELIASVEYEFQDGVVRLTVDDKRLQNVKARMAEMTQLNISSSKNELVKLGVRFNIIGVDMLIEKSQALLHDIAISQNSSSLKRYQDIMTELVNDPEIFVKEGNSDRLKRVLFLYSGTALAELYIESGQPEMVRHVEDQLVHVFKEKQRLNIQSIIIDSAWTHNKEALRNIMESVKVA